jgi:hypothetical protein
MLEDKIKALAELQEKAAKLEQEIHDDTGLPYGWSVCSDCVVMHGEVSISSENCDEENLIVSVWEKSAQYSSGISLYKDGDTIRINDLDAIRAALKILDARAAAKNKKKKEVKGNNV